MKNVLVIGATGFQGRAVVDALLEKKYRVKALVTKQERAMLPPEVEITLGDLNDVESLKNAFKNVDYVSLVFPLIFNTVQLMVFARNTIETYRSSAVKRIVFNTSLPLGGGGQGYVAFDSKLAIEKLFDVARLPYISLRPPIYLDNILAPWSIPLIMNKGTLAYPIASGQQVAWLSHRNLALFTVEAIEQPELVGKKINISGPELLTGEDIADALSKELGRAIQYLPVTPDEFELQLADTFGQSTAQEIANIYRVAESNPHIFQSTDWKQAFPIALQTLQQWTKQSLSSIPPELQKIKEYFVGFYNCNDASKASQLAEDLLSPDFYD